MLDPVLRGFVDAHDEDEAQRRLEALLETRIEPLVRTIVSRKLKAYGTKPIIPSEDLEDVAADTIVLLLKRLQAVRHQAGQGAIASLENYTAAVAFSVCALYFRRRYPERSRLKNRLRYVLERDRRFATWETADAGAHCGLMGWHGVAPASADVVAAVERAPERWPRSWRRPSSIDRADPAPLLAEIFHTIGAPLELDRLVSLVAAVWQIDRERRSGSVGPFGRLADAAASPEVALDRRRLMERLWMEVQELPLRQRVALLLNLRDGHGAGILWLLPVTGIASMRAIARTLDMPIEELSALWNRLPLDDNAIAERLAGTRQQIINLRMSARKRLSNRLARATAAPEGPGNLGGLSLSLESDT